MKEYTLYICVEGYPKPVHVRSKDWKVLRVIFKRIWDAMPSCPPTRLDFKTEHGLYALDQSLIRAIYLDHYEQKETT